MQKSWDGLPFFVFRVLCVVIWNHQPILYESYVTGGNWSFAGNTSLFRIWNLRPFLFMLAIMLLGSGPSFQTFCSGNCRRQKDRKNNRTVWYGYISVDHVKIRTFCIVLRHVQLLRCWTLRAAVQRLSGACVRFGHRSRWQPLRWPPRCCWWKFWSRCSGTCRPIVVMPRWWTYGWNLWFPFCLYNWWPFFPEMIKMINMTFLGEEVKIGGSELGARGVVFLLWTPGDAQTLLVVLLFFGRQQDTKVDILGPCCWVWLLLATSVAWWRPSHRHRTWHHCRWRFWSVVGIFTGSFFFQALRQHGHDITWSEWFHPQQRALQVSYAINIQQGHELLWDLAEHHFLFSGLSVRFLFRDLWTGQQRAAVVIEPDIPGYALAFPSASWRFWCRGCCFSWSIALTSLNRRRTPCRPGKMVMLPQRKDVWFLSDLLLPILALSSCDLEFLPFWEGGFVSFSLARLRD